MSRKMSKLEIYQEQQVLLSKERTILSFMRTGLAFITAGIVVAGFFETFLLAQVVGYILIFTGFVEVFESIRRLLVKQKEANELKKYLEKH